QKRTEQKVAVQDLTEQLKIFCVVQSKFHSTQSVDGSYKPDDNAFSASDFNYYSVTDFQNSPEYNYLTDNGITTHTDFL
ncbi:virulence-associated V antigen, partial [Vibrio parahaemolyticus]|nr:virulence-associated V antigen [Vibrio parahaemolyticus]